MKTLGENLKQSQEMFVNKEISANIYKYISDLVTIANANDIQRSSEEIKEELYEDIFGGKFYLVEKLEDLKEIKTDIFKDLSLFDKAGAFDGAKFIESDESLVEIIDITNNAGGNVYIIPKEYQTENVLESIELTKEMWS